MPPFVAGHVGSTMTKHVSSAPSIGYIYALIDPRSGEIRYIGSSMDPQRRLREHGKLAKRDYGLHTLGRTKWQTPAPNRRQRYALRARCQWLYELRQAKFDPRMLILDTCSLAAMPEVESHYISHYWDRARLFNANCPRRMEGFNSIYALYERPVGSGIVPEHVKEVQRQRRFSERSKRWSLTSCEKRWLNGEALETARCRSCGKWRCACEMPWP